MQLNKQKTKVSFLKKLLNLFDKSTYENKRIYLIYTGNARTTHKYLYRVEHINEKKKFVRLFNLSNREFWNIPFDTANSNINFAIANFFAKEDLKPILIDESYLSLPDTYIRIDTGKDDIVLYNSSSTVGERHTMNMDDFEKLYKEYADKMTNYEREIYSAEQWRYKNSKEKERGYTFHTDKEDDIRYTIKPKKQRKTMKDIKNQVTDANVEAAKVAAQLTAGNVLNKTVKEKIAPQLPLFVKGYADHPLANVFVANVVSFAVANFLADNKKAQWAADAMMVAAMADFMDSFNLDEVVNDLLANVAIPEVE